MNKKIYLLKIGEIDPSILHDLKKNLKTEFNNFNIKVEILKEGLKLRKTDFNSMKKQYKAPNLLKKIIEISKKKDLFRVLGILDEDIYSKNYNFIFGLAERGYHSALISVARLRENFYIKSSDLYRKLDSKEKFRERVLKEAKHELGHTFGLKHCKKRCIMQFSNSLADTDKKPVEYCDTCSSILKSIFIKWHSIF
ncbi:MAG: archaemetzincin family Zn-dependent metalloprotease [Promethearchaeota archaeon]